MKRLAIFVSGSGTNMENLIKTIRKEKIPFDPVVVICDRPGVQALDRANKLNVATVLKDRKTFPTKELFEEAILAVLKEFKVEFIALAGFMRILSADFIKHYAKRIINIHPSHGLIYRGAHVIPEAYAANKGKPSALQAGSGVTVHFVVPEVDAGEIILQRVVPISEEDTLETFEAHIHEVEYEIYPAALRKLAEGQ